MLKPLGGHGGDGVVRVRDAAQLEKIIAAAVGKFLRLYKSKTTITTTTTSNNNHNKFILIVLIYLERDSGLVAESAKVIINDDTVEKANETINSNNVNNNQTPIRIPKVESVEFRLPCLAMRFLTHVTEGDKRLICVGPTVIGCSLRRPANGQVSDCL